MARIEEVNRICGKCWEQLGIITFMWEEIGEMQYKVHNHEEFKKNHKTQIRIIEELEKPSDWKG